MLYYKYCMYSNIFTKKYVKSQTSVQILILLHMKWENTSILLKDHIYYIFINTVIYRLFLVVVIHFMFPKKILTGCNHMYEVINRLNDSCFRIWLHRGFIIRNSLIVSLDLWLNAVVWTCWNLFVVFRRDSLNTFVLFGRTAH